MKKAANDAKNDKSNTGICVILHDIRSAHNVGSAFRTCDAAGIACLYLCGYTPAPTDRFGRIRKDIAKVALGAEQALLWKHETSIADLIARLKKEDYTIVAIEQSPKAADYKSLKLGKQENARVAIIFGNEVEGVPADILALCDIIAEIPMRGTKESLNVSVALGIALFRMLGI